MFRKNVPQNVPQKLIKARRAQPIEPKAAALNRSYFSSFIHFCSTSSMWLIYGIFKMCCILTLKLDV